MLPGRAAGCFVERRFRYRALGGGHQCRLFRGDVSGELVVKLVLLDVQVLAPIGQRYRRSQRWAQRAAREFAGQPGDGFPGLRCKRTDVNQGFDVCMIVGRITDNVAAIGVADQHHRRMNARQQCRDCRTIALYTAQWVGSGNHRVTVLLENLHDAIPTRRIGKGAMYEHNRGFFSLRPGVCRHAQADGDGQCG